MKHLMFISAVLVSLFLDFGDISAQSADRLVKEIRTAAADACVKVSYTFKAEVDDVSVSDIGYVEAQDDMWHLKGDAYEIFTDGKATWILDPSSKEAVVEPSWTYDDLENFYLSMEASGSVFDISIESIDEGPKKSLSYFTPVLDSEWVVTDLR